ncbi:Uncharacterised protein [Mycobacteroides abscessus subsp. abscessus]|nr:Uncharacterised protein [Mycobacteroides abscessus subsp. abscessus]SKS09754.1 Uncharacterised protein [Mycobacteroides abscessus subsp. abscessus]SKV63008.1 Uncharacterised protein [Mycobacteroides abscessus subsp. abscessus]
MACRSSALTFSGNLASPSISTYATGVVPLSSTRSSKPTCTPPESTFARPGRFSTLENSILRRYVFLGR